MERYSEDHRIWLFDLVHGNLNENEMVQGFIRFYVLEGLAIGNVQDDCVFRTQYPSDKVTGGLQALRAALEKMAGVKEL